MEYSRRSILVGGRRSYRASFNPRQRRRRGSSPMQAVERIARALNSRVEAFAPRCAGLPTSRTRRAEFPDQPAQIHSAAGPIFQRRRSVLRNAWLH